MPTTKRRISITADKDIEKALILSAKRAGVPIAAKAAELLRGALELEEDMAWIKLADKRMSEKNLTFVSHKEAWKHHISK